jgi:biotin-dependent carboxylase-like uncharacterized protein
MTALIVEACGPGTSLQDQGRFGWQKAGLGPAGAMDRLAQAEANLLVGNGPGAAVIEFALAGGRFRVDDGLCRMAYAGATQHVDVDGEVVPALTARTVRAGQVIAIGASRDRPFGYLAVAGGFALTPQLGSLALHVRAGIGGIEGRPLRSGDRLPLALVAPPGPDLMARAAVPRGNGPIRVILGPQDDHFTPDGLATFTSSAYTVTPNADRMGIRFTGPKIAHGPQGYNIVSDGIATGAIQVPGSGEPIVLLADRQTTGGYPKIATVISADLPRLSQARPGDTIRFAIVTRAEAVAALVAQRTALEAFRASLAPVGGIDTQRLSSANLIDGVWVAD